MTDITIPTEAVEAAAKALYEAWCKVHGVEDTSMPWGDIDDEERDACFAEAIAALRAGIAAWPGIDTGPNIYGRQNAIIHLPLPTENTNAEG